MAAGPILLLIIYLIASKRWKMNFWQITAVFGPLLAFLVVGLIISSKIGGGGDLHNLDMFLISVMFTAMIAWKNGGKELFLEEKNQPAWVNIFLLLLVFIPTFQHMQSIAPLEILVSHNLSSRSHRTLQVFNTIRTEVEMEKENGEILFLDQRQLLTFGYIEDVPLVVDYEKKVVMSEAMAGNKEYFDLFYKDLENKRFSLIISEPLRSSENLQDISSHSFAAENNAWIQWVSEPVLCYYEIFDTFEDVRVMLLKPRQDASSCSSYTP